MNSAAKVIQFPLAGIAKDQDYRKAYIPSEGVAFATPFAVNVLGDCTFGDRKRGGSRPGLKNYSGIGTSATPRWLWPNGDYIDWSDSTASALSRITFTADATNVAPDGSILFDQHADFTVTAAKGSVPGDWESMAKYRGRLVIAGGTMWYMSRQGDMTDFDYGGDGDDIGRACAGNVALADQAGEAVTAIAALEDKYFIAATKRSLRILAGEPTSGEWATASAFTGIVSRDAWCWDGATFWFVGANGLYALTPGDNVVKRASGRLPDDFKGWTKAVLVYDAERSGIHIIREEVDEEIQETVREHWFYDIGEGAFWKLDYDADIEPIAGALCMVDGVNRVVFECADGVWRYWDAATATDGGETMASKVAIGPFRASLRDDYDGMLGELAVTLADDSANVTVEVYKGDSPELAVWHAKNGNAPKATLAAGEGRNRIWRPRVRGAWIVLVLKSTGRWGYESMTATCKMLGRLRNG